MNAGCRDFTGKSIQGLEFFFWVIVKDNGRTIVRGKTLIPKKLPKPRKLFLRLSVKIADD